MKYGLILLIAMTTTPVLLGIHTTRSYKPVLRIVSTIVRNSLIKVRTGTNTIYNAVWGSSPDITLPDKESKQTVDPYVQMMTYPRNITYHLTRVGLVKKNTHIRSRTIGILAGILGSGLAYRICGGIHNNRSAFRIAASGLAAGLCSWFFRNAPHQSSQTNNS